MAPINERFKSAWNAFLGRDPTLEQDFKYVGGGTSYRPDRYFYRIGCDKSFKNAIYNRIANDVAAVTIEHARVDQNGMYSETIHSGLNNVLTLDANTDQTGRSLIIDLVISLLDEGCVALVPTDTNVDPNRTDSYDILTARVGAITQWYPEHVKVKLYNERTGRQEEIMLPKRTIAIIENPFFSVMNEPNSTLKRLSRKLALLDIVDEQSSAGKLDLIIQLPYVIKSDARKQQADMRRKDIEMQLAGSKYGIAYTDGTEKITQLNRSLDNNILKQVEFLTAQLYNELGLTEEVFKGTADAEKMLNYYNRTVEPILSAITDELNRKFLTKTARTQGQRIVFRTNQFKLVPMDKLSDIANNFTRNEILSSNEVRALIGFKPVESARADELVNKNINTIQNEEQAVVDDAVNEAAKDEPMTDEEFEEMMSEFDKVDDELNGLEKDIQDE